MDLSGDHWRALPAAERERLAGRLAAALPAGFAFEAVRPFALGGQDHEVALFRFADATFALLPGGPAALGFDADGWEPAADEAASWAGTATEYGLDPSPRPHVAAVTGRPRAVTLPPVLVETVAREVGWEPIPADHPAMREALRGRGGAGTVELHRSDISVRVRRHPDGSVTAEQSAGVTHAGLTAGLAAAGFRFPTADEWEHACGGGATTLFRWGDHAPCDRYPTDISPAEADWRRRWVLSAGRLERPPEGFAADWDWHRRPNAFGLLIASDPYQRELVAEAGVTRGGDGGGTVCGGAGFFAGWLTLATAYREDHASTYDPTEALSPGHTVGRRVLPLG